MSVSAARATRTSSTTDADLFVTLRVQDSDGREVSLVSAIDPHGVLAVGWLRASHRELDASRRAGRGTRTPASSR